MSLHYSANSLSAGPAPCHECLRKSRCLGGALAGESAEAAADAGVTRGVLSRGEHLFRIGDAADAIYVVRSGATKSYVVSSEGDEEILGFQLSDDAAGLDAIGSNTYRSSTKALSRSWLCRLPMASVRKKLAESDNFREHLLGSIGQEFARLHGMLHRERCTAEQRVASFLLKHLQEKEQERQTRVDEVELPMSRSDLARYLDLATETVSRVFTRLQGKNLLECSGSRCRIVDRQGLAALA